ncbi:MAG TPA: hypothetical protein DCM40_22190, partial [Maribacter sp.]|nr:hypothetical protein [Maribacter sp.]
GALGFVGPDYPYPSTASWYRRVSPRARLLRGNGLGVKRPLNIANIRTTASFGGPGDSVGAGATVGGNFDKNYQVVHSTGRCVNNLWFREAQSASVPTRINNINVNDDRLHATTHIHSLFSPGTVNLHTWISVNSRLTGTFGIKSGGGHRNRFYNYAPENMLLTLPKRGENTLNAKNKTIFVNRFSAPGGFDVMSRGFLDIHCEEHSVYNALPYRNLTVRTSGSGEANSLRIINHLTASRASRDGLNTWWRRHSARFGADPIHAKSFINGSSLGYLDAPSFYRQYHRNSRDRVEITDDTGILSPLQQRVGTGNKQRYDNAWIRHTLPQNE